MGGGRVGATYGFSEQSEERREVNAGFRHYSGIGLYKAGWQCVVLLKPIANAFFSNNWPLGSVL